MQLTPRQKALLARADDALVSLPPDVALHNATLVSLERHGLVQIYRAGDRSFWCVTEKGEAKREQLANRSRETAG